MFKDYKMRRRHEIYFREQYLKSHLYEAKCDTVGKLDSWPARFADIFYGSYTLIISIRIYRLGIKETYAC